MKSLALVLISFFMSMAAHAGTSFPIPLDTESYRSPFTVHAKAIEEGLIDAGAKACSGIEKFEGLTEIKIQITADQASLDNTTDSFRRYKKALNVWYPKIQASAIANCK